MPLITVFLALFTFVTCIYLSLLLGINFSPHHSTTMTYCINLLLEKYEFKHNFAFAPA